MGIPPQITLKISSDPIEAGLRKTPPYSIYKGEDILYISQKSGDSSFNISIHLINSFTDKKNLPYGDKEFANGSVIPIKISQYNNIGFSIQTGTRDIEYTFSLHFKSNVDATNIL